MKTRWFVVSLVLVGLALLPLGVKLWIEAAEPRRWQAMQSQLAVLARDARARETTRPVVRGTPVPGNAWDDYESSALSIKPTAVGSCWEVVQGNPKADRVKAEAIVATHAAALPVLRRGASRATADRRTDWERKQFLGTYPGITLAVCHARFLIEAGRLREGAEWLSDAGQFGLDLARNGDVIDAATGINILSLVHNELRRALPSPGWGSDDLLEIDREMGVLEQNYPRPAENHLNDAMVLGFLFLRTGTIKEVMDQYGFTKFDIPTWRYGYSERIMMVDAFEEFLSGARRLAAAESKPWAEFREIQRQVNLEQGRSWNPLVRQLSATIGNEGPEAHHRNFVRESLAHHRMIRTAVRFLATGDVPALEDPFGEKLVTRREGKRLKIWSIGGDSVDDQGAGDWKPAKIKDIVLEVERR